jgi:integrase
MPKIAMELNKDEVAAKASEPGFHPVGGVPGLALVVSATGARSWVLRFAWGARRRDLGLGGYPAVTLASARQRARDAREQIARGVDPVGDRKARRDALLAEQAKGVTFEQAARQCHRVRVEDFSNAKHRKDWLSSLERLAFPMIGKHRVCDVTNLDVVRVLEPVWKSTPETATRLRQRIESVMSWATVAGYREGPNPARWDGNLKELLPKPKRVRTHYPALHFEQFPAFIAELRKMPGTAARALEFIALTAARSGEARLARWPEIDMKARVWRVPASRMKARKPHAVPLSDAALALLEALPRLQGNPHVFASPRGGAYSDMSLTAVLRRMKVEIVPHGFRSTFKEWARNLRTADNVPRYADEVSELALAHVNSDATRAAYARDALLDQRRDLMAEWGEFITTAPEGDA